MVIYMEFPMEMSSFRFELASRTNASVHVTVMRVVVPVYNNVTSDDHLACPETPSAVTTPPHGASKEFQWHQMLRRLLLSASPTLFPAEIQRCFFSSSTVKSTLMMRKWFSVLRSTSSRASSEPIS